MIIFLQICFATGAIVWSGFFGFVLVAEIRRHRAKVGSLKSSLPVGKDRTAWGICAIPAVILLMSNVTVFDSMPLKIIVLALVPAMLVVAIQFTRLLRNPANPA